MADFGNLSLMLALGLAIYGTVAALLSAIYARERLRIASRRAFLGAGVMVVCAVVALGILFSNNDFSVVYVQRNSNLAMPWYYKITAVWAGSAGSLLWWTTILCVYNAVFLLLTRKAPRLMMSWAYVFIGMGIIFFLVINNIVSNPFDTWHEIVPGQGAQVIEPREGTGMNPQLQHWAMIIHPPLLYTGYIGFLFPFAMALGALITRVESRDWLALTRNWTLTAWLILGVGIILGGAWAYMELGWGGYWAWDPVENASFMPWLLATAYVHSVLAQETRGMFKKWNILLLMSTYLMCLFGTFITRSGLISSVHSFAKSDIGYYFIGYIAITAILAVIVVILRRDQLRDDNAYDSFVSREVGLLFNNVMFVTICVTMLLATIYPMVTEWLYDVKRELRHGFYNKVEIPLFLGMIFLMAIGPIITWKRTSKRLIRERFLWPSVIAIVSLPFFYFTAEGSRISGTIGGFEISYPPAPLSYALCVFLMVTILQEFWEAASRRAKRANESFFTALVSIVRLNKRRYGGYIAHFSILLMAIGITGAAFNLQDKKELGVGEIMTLGPHTFQIAKIDDYNTDNYAALKATVHLLEDGKATRTFYPEQRVYHASQAQASEVGIDVTLQRDYYVVLAGLAPDSTDEHRVGVFHIYVNPLVIWIWIGSVFMVIGTLISMLPNKVRVSATERVAIGTGELA